MLYPMPDKIIVLFLVYGDKHITAGVEKLNEIVSRMFPNSAVEYIVVDNAQHQSYYHCENDRITIGGDNSLWEFSGWDRGVSFVKENVKLSRHSMILFANDTFNRRSYKDGTEFLDVFDSPIIYNKDVVNSAIGYLDDFPKDVSLNGILYKSWIRSNIFILPISVVEKLHPFSTVMDPSEVFSTDYEKFWSDTNLISDNWKAYIASWLFGIENEEYPEYCLHWLKATHVNAENHEFFKKKALCILAEHFLTARLFDMGVPIIDTNIFEKNKDRHVSAYYV